MNKQELQNKIEDLEKQLAEVKEQVNSIEFEGIKKGVRWKPKCGVVYFYLKHDGYIGSTHWGIEDTDLFRFNTGNCFKTEQEAEEYKENLLTKQALKDLALELNNGVEIDWDNKSQSSCYIFYEYDYKKLTKQWLCTLKPFDVPCLNNQFLDIAKERIGEEKLIKLIKSGV